jgi:spore coat protein A, manganese oxidase
MAEFTRRKFIQSGLAAGSTLAFQWSTGLSLARATAPVSLEKYVDPLPRPGAGLVVASPSGTNRYTFTQRQIARKVHRDLPPTPLWAYDDGSGLGGQAGSLGIVVVAQCGTPLTMQYTHALPATYPTWLPVDIRLTPMGNQVRVLTHLHGGFVTGQSDGNPAVIPRGIGPGETQTVYYPNQSPQNPASMLWFHDHGLGVTRLNVFAGLAGAYVLRDQHDTGTEPNPIGIPGGAYEIPLVIQDRQFNADGTLLYPLSDIAGVTWIGEYFGDVMLVNGKAWPYLEVEPRLYRFRFLNGCNARILNLNLGGTRLWQIGAESGLFDVPVPVSRLVLAPGERADVLVDFGRLAGQTLVLTNQSPPKPVATPAPRLPQVMQVRVGTKVTQVGPKAIPETLPGQKADLPGGSVVTRRYITLNEVNPETSSWFLNLNAARFDEPVTENPKVGTIEEWVYINLTGDTHPMHPHLTKFQVVGRTPMNVKAYVAAYGGLYGVPGGIDPSAYATGPIELMPEERGFKDTVKVNPGYFTTIRILFDLPDGATAPQTYVHHCHILEHEDNDMMRPFVVVG